VRISVLDHGYVRRVDVLGSDLSIVNAARVSYDKESEEFSARDEKLLAFLMREGHTSPFRHAALTFEAYAPLLVARQWWKYAVSSTHLDDQNGWNESSRRYITENETFYVPDKWEWRAAPENSKQGSDGNLDFVSDEEFKNMVSDDSVDWNPPRLGNYWTEKLMHMVRLGELYYQEAIRNNVAPEQARLFLPAYSLYVRWRWTISLAGVMNFLDQRLEHDAQYEIQKYAQAVRDLTVGAFPKVMEARSNLGS
jgi:thymidylate synthase (FAD)